MARGKCFSDSLSAMHFLILFLWTIDLNAAALYPKEVNINNDTSVCGSQRTFTDVIGFIKSPGYPIRYPSNVFCSYDIIAPKNKRVELHWKDFDIDGNMPDCDNIDEDYVEIYAGCGNSRKYIARFCSKNSGMPHSIFSTDNCLSVSIFTHPVDLGKISRGFHALYKAVDSNEEMEYQKCNRTLHENAGIIHSSYWPQTYNSSKSNWDVCSWKLKVGESMAIKFVFMDVDTRCSYYHPYYGNCNQYCSWYERDEIGLQGIASLYASKKLQKSFYGYCKPFSFTASYSEFLIKWKKRPSYYHQLRGFMIGYVAYRPVNQNVFFTAWQYGLLIFAVILAMVVTFVFACRRARQLTHEKDQGYTFLVNVGTDTADLRTSEDFDEQQTTTGCTGELVENADQHNTGREEMTNNDTNASHSNSDNVAQMSDNGHCISMSNFANMGTSLVSSFDSADEISHGRWAQPHTANFSRIDVLFNPNRSNEETLTSTQNVSNSSSDQVRFRPRPTYREQNQVDYNNMFSDRAEPEENPSSNFESDSAPSKLMKMDPDTDPGSTLPANSAIIPQATVPADPSAPIRDSFDKAVPRSESFTSGDQPTNQEVMRQADLTIPLHDNHEKIVPGFVFAPDHHNNPRASTAESNTADPTATAYESRDEFLPCYTEARYNVPIHVPDSDPQSDAGMLSQPPAYEDIVNELHSLTNLVDEIMADFNQH